MSLMSERIGRNHPVREAPCIHILLLSLLLKAFYMLLLILGYGPFYVDVAGDDELWFLLS